MVDRSHRDTFRGRILSFIWLYAMQKKRHAHHVSCYGLWESCGSCRGAEGSQATSGFSLCLGEMSVILKSEKERSFLDADVPTDRVSLTHLEGAHIHWTLPPISSGHMRGI